MEVCALEQVRGEGEPEIARLAQLQFGLVHRNQLLAAGIGRGAISHRLGCGRLTSVYRGVYALDGMPTKPLARATAAVLHLHGFAALSHGAAAALWAIIDPEAERAEVTVFGAGVHDRDHLTVHRLRALTAADIRRRRGLPVTSPARTLLDLAGSQPQLILENALAECRRRGLASNSEIEAAIERSPGRAGCGRLQALLQEGAPALTRSKAERLLLELIRKADLPPPLANAKVCGHMVDLLWERQRLIVEFDGWETHGRRQAFETDRRRDQRLVAAGYRVIRITWRQLEREPYAVVARLAAALA